MNKRLAIILDSIIISFSNIAILLMTFSFILAFVNAHNDYLSTLSPIMLFGIPLGLMVLALKIISMNWSPIRFAKDEVGE